MEVTEEKTLYHVNLLSNFIAGFDKYSKTYSKKNIKNSTYPNEFYLLEKEDISIGVDKYTKVLHKVGITGNELILLKTVVSKNKVFPNIRNGLGVFLKQNWIPISEVYIFENKGFKSVSVEYLASKAIQITLDNERSYEFTKPRSVSILPVAIGCQAKCKFCFSKGSISSEQGTTKFDFKIIKKTLVKAKKEGAERVVITGGGEPTLIKEEKLLELIKLCSNYYNKTVLISNGYHIANSNTPKEKLKSLVDSGLNVLSISIHHYNKTLNEEIMGISIAFDKIISASKQLQSANFKIRLICVLQKEGIATRSDVLNYIHWAMEEGITEVCFKELYVSTQLESLYATTEANRYSRKNQVSLNVVTETAKECQWTLVDQLPWGAPIYEYKKGEKQIRIAAYTEPSVFWELQNKICRSWNLMADMKCYASLETKQSEISI